MSKVKGGNDTLGRRNGKKLKILYAEDDVNCSYPIEFFIKREFKGSSVDVVISKKDTLSKVDELAGKGERYDLFLIDIMLEDGFFAGLEIVEELHKRSLQGTNPMSDVIITSLVPEKGILEYHGEQVANPPKKRKEFVKTLEKYKVKQILTKPVDTRKLKEIIIELIESEKNEETSNG